MTDTKTWPDLAVGLHDKGRHAEIPYAFDGFNVEVPSKADDGAEHARWRVDGVLEVHTRDRALGT